MRTIRQSRTKTSWALLGSLAFMLIAEWMRHQPGDARHSAEYYELFGALGALTFGFCAVMAIVYLFQPARLLIGEVGIAYLRPFSHKRWAWRDVSEFQIEEATRGARLIRFSAGDGSRPWIADNWMLELDEVCATLNAARAASLAKDPVAPPS